MNPITLRTGAKETRWFVRVLAGFALFAICGAINEWLNPSAPPFKGRLSWVISVVFTLAGPTGLVALWLFGALALAFTARFIWRHTPRVPTDRWLW